MILRKIGLSLILLQYFLSTTGCQKQTIVPVVVSQTAQATTTNIQETILMVSPTRTKAPVIEITPYRSILKKLKPDIYLVYWSNNTWHIKGHVASESSKIELTPGITSKINTGLELSPDNNSIAFSNSAGNLSIYNLLTGSLKSYANPNVNDIYELEWLTNGDTILYLGTPEEIWVPDSNVGLYNVSIKHQTVNTIFDWKKESELFKYGLRGITSSKDGKWLAFYAPQLSEIMAPDPKYSVYIMDLSCLQASERCSQAIQLVGSGISPAWSPDGKLGWICKNENSSALCITDVNQPTPSQVLFDVFNITTSQETSFSTFSWSPDGKWLAIDIEKSSGINNTNNSPAYVLITSLDGKEIIKVTSDSGTDTFQEGWSPDGQYLAYSNVIGYTEPYGDIGVKFPVSDLFLYNLQNGKAIDLFEETNTREVFNSFLEIK